MRTHVCVRGGGDNDEEHKYGDDDDDDVDDDTLLSQQIHDKQAQVPSDQCVIRNRGWPTAERERERETLFVV